LINSFKKAVGNGVKIIVVTVKQSDQDNKYLRTEHHRAWMTNYNEIISAALNSSKNGGIFIYHLDPVYLDDTVKNNRIPTRPTDYDESEKFDKRFQIYVHSKLMIIDDEFVSIGSANLNNRSMTTDSELTITMISSVVAKYIRKSIWSKILNVPPEQIESPLSTSGAAPNENWPNLMKQNSGIVAVHNQKVGTPEEPVYLFPLQQNGEILKISGWLFKYILNPFKLDKNDRSNST
jgi:phosphatidylserine/phosphatidylglycerophosphate/cardiolipin synthase-like enzyme